MLLGQVMKSLHYIEAQFKLWILASMVTANSSLLLLKDFFYGVVSFKINLYSLSMPQGTKVMSYCRESSSSM